MKHSKLLRAYLEEMALKNQAYFFILRNNLFDKFREFDRENPIECFLNKTPVETAISDVEIVPKENNANNQNG